MALTQKQENFCLEYIKCGNASEAYKKCYNVENMKPESIYRKATELMANGTISARVQELRDKAESKAIMSLEDRMKKLSEIANNVTYDKDGNASYTDARGAIDLLNKMEGVYVQKNQTELSGEVGVKFHIDLGE